jgi:hypothetical protein
MSHRASMAHENPTCHGRGGVRNWPVCVHGPTFYFECIECYEWGRARVLSLRVRNGWAVEGEVGAWVDGRHHRRSSHCHASSFGPPYCNTFLMETGFVGTTSVVNTRWFCYR